MHEPFEHWRSHQLSPLGPHSVAAQDLMRYRAYTLESSVAEVVKISEATRLRREVAPREACENSAAGMAPPGRTARSRGRRSRSGHHLSFLQRCAVPAPCHLRSRAHGRSDQRRRHRIGVRGVSVFHRFGPQAPAASQPPRWRRTRPW